MAEHVEGPWKNFYFRMAQPSDYPKILEHVARCFYKDEPLSRQSIYDDEMAEDANKIVALALTDNLSFLAEDKSTGKIAGVRIISINRKSEQHPDEIPFSPSHPKVIIIMNYLNKLSEQIKIFELYPDLTEYIDFLLVSVDPEFRGCGLATEIYDRAFKLLKAKNFRLIKCIFTSPYTQRVARKREFKELARLKLNEWKNERGAAYWPNAKDDEVGILMVKEI